MIASTSMSVENRLEGATNFLSWKEITTLALKKYDHWERVEKVVIPLTDPQDLVVQQKKDIKSHQVILDSVKDHLIPHLSKKNMAKEIIDSLVGLFHSNNMNRKMFLRNKLRSRNMFISDNVTSYFMRITSVHDQLASKDEKLDGVDLVNVALNGFPKSWEPFVKGVCARENLPDWQRLWDDCIQKETREESKVDKKGDEEKDNLTLVSKTRKGKGKGSSKKGDGEESTSQLGKKDLSKIKWFTCHKYGHYA
jgi:hypothetical protein